MHCQWVLWCNTTLERKAAKLLDRVLVALGREPTSIAYDPDIDIPGIRVTFTTALPNLARDSCIVEAMALCQKVGANWMIEGSVHKCLSFSCQHTHISGVSICECYLVEASSGDA
jgi:hypothetical protein